MTMREHFRGPRDWLRDRVINLLKKAVATDELRQAITDSLGSSLAPPLGRIDSATIKETPYGDLGVSSSRPSASDRDDLVIITGRFRSGSTLLWNLFRQLPEFTCYYEPLNERRWFDPQSRGNRVDSTHRAVDDYWAEYQGLEEAGRYFQESWNERDLFMTSESVDVSLRRYLDCLIDAAPGRPLLQLNRADFRLPWLRECYPHARFIHLYRHPRDQWCSTLLQMDSFGPLATMDEWKEQDRFYLSHWVRDLSYRFPFLRDDQVAHPYEQYYLIWKLSYIYGRSYADVSVSFESLVTSTESVLQELLILVNVDPSMAAGLTSVISAPPLGKWRRYADAAWFREIEQRCEDTLRDFFASHPRLAGADAGHAVPPCAEQAALGDAEAVLAGHGQEGNDAVQT